MLLLLPNGVAVPALGGPAVWLLGAIFLVLITLRWRSAPVAR